MKKSVKILLIILAVLILIPVSIQLFIYLTLYPSYRADKEIGNLRIPAGYLSRRLSTQPTGFQDWTDSYEFFYPEDFVFPEDPDYAGVADDDIPEINGYFSNFQAWVDSEEQPREYSFNPDCIDTGDHFRIETKEGERSGKNVFGKYDYYSVYLYDSESRILYVIRHKNQFQRASLPVQSAPVNENGLAQ